MCVFELRIALSKVLCCAIIHRQPCSPAAISAWLQSVSDEVKGSWAYCRKALKVGMCTPSCPPRCSFRSVFQLTSCKHVHKSQPLCLHMVKKMLTCLQGVPVLSACPCMI